MTPTFSSPHALSDRDLLAQLDRAVQLERHATAQVIALLMEVDSRKLYAQQSCSSLFTYCVQVLHFSEHAAYLRIEAARAARRFPVILDRLADGSLHLTAVSLLASHLTEANHLEILHAARHKTKRQVEELIARLWPQPDIPAAVRKLPTPQPHVSTVPPQLAPPTQVGIDQDAVPVGGLRQSVTPLPARRAEVTPLAPERFRVQFTVGRDTHDKLRKAQDLLRHAIPNGDPAAIFDRALTLLIADLSKTRQAATDQPRRGRTARGRTRHIPAAVKREVWRRDEGQCAFRGVRGRCAETGFLEFHHVVPYAKGGPTSVENLELRCRTHNVYEAEQQFGRCGPSLWAREAAPGYAAAPD
jgi:5-methylcytosine-specific restriction endonuclease McrA